MHRYHRCQGFRYLRSQQLLFESGVYGYRAVNRRGIAFCAASCPGQSGSAEPAPAVAARPETLRAGN